MSQQARPGFFRRTLQRLAGSTPPVQVRRFEAARIDRLTAGWFATESSINQELSNDLNSLRRRGRELDNNNDYARKFRGMVEDNVIGPGGIRLQAKVEDNPARPDNAANDAIESAWARWGAVCDVTGGLSFRDLCASIVGSLPSDGEFLVRMVRGADAGNAFNFALQVIDVDRIDTAYNGTFGGNTVIMGVEVNAYRRPVALWLFEAHPSDGVRTGRRRVRVPAADLIHGFRRVRAEQMRGIPWMAPGMLSLHHLSNFMQSAILAAEHGANHYGFFKQSIDAQGGPPVGTIEGAAEGDPVNISTSQPGIYDTLPVGYEFQQHDSKYPNEVFGPFSKTVLQRIATGWRVAYHSLANDLEGVSFSSIRSGTLEERDRWMVDQQWFIDCFMEPVFQAWLQMALLSGQITTPNGAALPASKAAKFARHEWQPRRWEWVDPKSDMEAKILSVRAGLMAPQDLSAAMGYDFEDTLKAIKRAQDLAASLGVNLTAYESTPGAMPANAAPAEPAASGRQMLDEMRSLSADLAGQVAAARQAQPVIHAHVTLPEQRHEHHVHLQAPAAPNVEIRNEITTPETVVNVEAVMPEQQRAEAPVVNVVNQVQPAPVTVNNAFARTATQVVARDQNDEITQTVTTYEA